MPPRWQFSGSPRGKETKDGNCAGYSHHFGRRCSAADKQFHRSGKKVQFAPGWRSAAFSTTQQTHRSAVRLLDLLNVGGVRTVSSYAPSAYKYITVRECKRNIRLLIDLGAKVAILHQSFFFCMKPSPQISTSTMKLHTYSGTPVTTLGAISTSIAYGTHFLHEFQL